LAKVFGRSCLLPEVTSMSAWNRSDSPHVLRALDSVFSQLGGKPDLECNPEAVATGQDNAAAPAEIQAPPKVETQADLQAAYEWLVRERKRLENYTNSQLARLKNDHAAMLSRHYTNEQVLILRSQELANKEEFLTRQTRSLQEQAEQLAEREKALAAQREDLCRAHDEYAVVQESCNGVRHDAEAQHALLDTLRAETIAIQRDREKAREDLEVMEQRHEQQREARDREQALLAARQTELDQRFSALQKAEEATERRLRELDDLEARLQQEIEDQESRLAAEHKAVAAMAAQLRQQTSEANGPKRREEILARLRAHRTQSGATRP
jgi:DNA repair exonuclease SbcCD ATPase subunit